MRKLVFLMYLFYSLAGTDIFAQTQQPNGQALPVDKGPYPSGQFYLLPIGMPPQVPSATAFPVSATGTTAYYYWIVTNDVDNVFKSYAAGPFKVTNGPGSLSSSHTIKIQWPVFSTPLTWGPLNPAAPVAVSGFPFTTNHVSYDVIETSTPTPPTPGSTCTCAVVIGTTGSFAIDNGTYSSYTVPISSPQFWPVGYAAPNDIVAVSSQGLIVDSGVQISAIGGGSVTTCSDPNLPGNPAYYSGASAVSCSPMWNYNGAGQLTALDGGGGTPVFTFGATQTNSHNGAATTITFPALTVTSGDLLLTISQLGSSGATVFASSVTDTQGNTWTEIPASKIGNGGLFGGAAQDIWWTFASATGTDTITTHNTGGTSFQGGMVGNYTGPFVTPNPVDTASGSIALNSVNVTTSFPNELIVNMFLTDSGTENWTNMTQRANWWADHLLPTASNFIAAVTPGTGNNITSMVALKFSASGPRSTLSLTGVDNYFVPACKDAATLSPSLVASHNMQQCEENTLAPGSDGLMHYYNLVSNLDLILTDAGQFLSTSGPTGVAFTTTRPHITATLAGTGFGAAGVSHSVGIVPDPGATAHSPVFVLGEDSAWHNPSTLFTGAVAIQSYTDKSLAGSVSFAGSTLTTVDSQAITMPSSGGPFRVQVCYSYNIQIGTGVLGEMYITDGTNNFALSSLITNSNGGTYSGCGYSPVTYTASSSHTFTVKVENTGSQTIQTTSAVTGQASKVQIVVYASN